MSDVNQLSTQRNTLRNQVARHPMIAFIILAYVLSCFWLLNDRIDLGMVNGFGIIGSASPALAAIIVSTILKPKPIGFQAGKRWRLFGIIGILVLAVMTALRFWNSAGLVTVSGMPALPRAYPSFMAFSVDVLAAAVVAFILSGVRSPRQGVRDLLHSLDPRDAPVRWYWWMVAAGIYPFVFILGNAISSLVGIPVPVPLAAGPWYFLILDILIMFVYYLFGGGGLEEPGWRGFALPLLLKRFSLLVSSLILSVIWTFWHLPMLWTAIAQSGPLVLVIYLLTVTAPFAILFTALFNRTRSSLPIVILMHTSINITGTYLPASSLATGLWLLLILVIAVWMWRSPQKFLPRQAETDNGL